MQPKSKSIVRLKVCQTNLANAIGFQQPLQCNHFVQITCELEQVLKVNPSASIVQELSQTEKSSMMST